MKKQDLLTSVLDLDRETWANLICDELNALGEGITSGGVFNAAYEIRERHGRCVCCSAFMSKDITGIYDGSTCWACGAAQEESEEEYNRVSAERRATIKRLYAKRYGSTSYDRAKKVLSALDARPESEPVAFPTFAVNHSRKFWGVKVEEQAPKSLFKVVDRGATQDSRLHRFSYVNPRYAIINVETREVVDEFTTKSSAAAATRDMNANIAREGA